MFERYTETARQAIFFARFQAIKLGADGIEPEHLALGLLQSDPEFIDQFFLEANMVSAKSLFAQIQNRVRNESPLPATTELPLSQTSKTVLQNALQAAEELRDYHIGLEHLLLALLQLDDSIPMRVFAENNITVASVHSVLLSQRSG